MITIQQIEEALAHAVRESATIRLIGYISSSTGERFDMTLKYRGPTLYTELLQETLKLVEKGDPTLLTKPADITPVDWEQATREQIASWRASTANPFVADRNTSYIRDPRGFLISQVDKTKRGIEFVEMIESTSKVSAHSGNYRNGVTKGKAVLRERAPTSRYAGLITLAPDKVDYIQIVT